MDCLEIRLVGESLIADNDSRTVLVWLGCDIVYYQ